MNYFCDISEKVDINTIPCGIIRCYDDDDYTLTVMNNTFLEMTGYTKEEIKLLFNNKLRQLMAEEDYQAIRYKLDQQEESEIKELEYRIKKKDSTTIWVSECSRIIKNEEGIDEFFCAITDISRIKKDLFSFIDRAERDSMTGLYNRLTTKVLIDTHLDNTDKNSICGFVIFDIDNLKRLNDTYGHLFVDTLIIDLASVLKKSVRKSDIVGRVGGDEMVMFLKDVTDEKSVKKIVTGALEKINSISRERIKTDMMSFSAGIALYPHDGLYFEELYENADQALYVAKRNGKGRVVEYSKIKEKELNSLETVEVNNEEEVYQQSIENNPLRIVEFVFNLLYESTNIPQAINIVLSMIGRRFDLSRIYIFENLNSKINNTFEWCAEGISPQISVLQNLSKECLKIYYDNLASANGFFYCDDILKLPLEQQEVLRKKDVKSTMHYQFVDNGEEWGFIGFDECRNMRYWDADTINVLRGIARVTGVFLKKYRIEG